MSPSGVLWDLDGTLVDSLDHHWRAWRDTLAADGITVSYEQFLWSFGRRNDRILRVWLGEDLPLEDVRRIGGAKEARYRELAEREGARWLPGTAEWVERLAADGWRQAVASAAPKLNVETVVRALGLGRHFGALVAAEDVSAGKPDPEIFLLAASRLGVDPSRCIVVEDADAGLEAARRAGMPSIGVSRTMHLDADITVESLTDLPPDAFARLLINS